jgi:hypothetical protein
MRRRRLLILARCRSPRPWRVVARSHRTRTSPPTRYNKRNTATKVFIGGVESGIAAFLVEVFLEVVGGGAIGALALCVQGLGLRLVGLALLGLPGVVGGGVTPPVAAAD